MEKVIRDLAERYGLEVLKRITTGDERAHFATFELSGVRAQEAHPVIRAVLGEKGCLFVSLRRVKNLDHPEYGTWYIEADSVWCDAEAATV